jgi:hypothetical protein
MFGFVHFLRCVGRAAVKNGGKALCSLVPFGEAAYEIARDACEEYRRDHSEADLRADLEQLARSSPAEARQAAEAVAAQEAADQSAEIQLALVSYLDQVPAAIRQSLRCPNNPGGTRPPSRISLNKPEDLLSLLPSRLPRFKPGDRPLAADWELVEMLGSGGFGEVWKARHLHRTSQKPVALKFCLDPVAAASLRNEATLHDLLDRVREDAPAPGIVSLLETYLRAEPPCLMYEYIEGGDLAGLIHDLHPHGRLTPEMATRMVHRLAVIVSSTHRLSPPLVHRDLKLSNVLVRRGEASLPELFVTDFGIGGLAAGQALRSQVSHATRSQTLPAAVRGAYTPLYASPQQVQGDPPDPRDDVHALGVIWYQLVTGDLGLLAIPPDWRDVVTERGLPRAQADLLAACIASRADKRPANAAALAERLAELLSAPPASETRPRERAITIESPKRTYTLLRLLATGDVADVHLASARSDPLDPADCLYAVKISRIEEGHSLLETERRTLVNLLSQAGTTTYSRYLPTLAESFLARDRFAKRVNVFLHEPGFYTLEQVHAQHAALDGRHLGWIFKRLLTVLGFCHQSATTVHAAVLPCHVLLHAANHGLQLVGWGQSVEMGKQVRMLSTKYRDWYPPEVFKKLPASAATDVFLAARCLIYLAGGDPVTNRMPDSVPTPMQRFLETCLLEGARMRPDNCWKLLEEFDELLRSLYGPPKFHDLAMI